MSPKKKILKTLTTAYEHTGPGTLLRPATIPGFGENPEKYQQAVNSLLQERLIEGMKDTEGRMAITINAQRIEEVKKTLRPIWVHPAFVAVLGLLAVAVGFGFMN